MTSGLIIGLTALTGWPSLPGVALGGFSRRSDSVARYIKAGIACWVAALAIGFVAWMLLPDSVSKTRSAEELRRPAGGVAKPVPSPSTVDTGGAQQEFAIAPVVANPPPVTERLPADGLSLSSQSWRRGGLGSKALVSFTLRNKNDYAVKDIEIICSFARRDGGHLTDRRRTISDTIGGKRRKTFSRLHIGFVNVHAVRAKCSVAAASRV